MPENPLAKPVKLLLASSSPYRRAQLEQLMLKFECAPPQVDESPRPKESPASLAARLALAKAQKVADGHPENTVIIAGDQCTALGNTLLGKPGSKIKAVEQLQACQGQQVTFYSGLCVLDQRKPNQYEACIKTAVKFRQLDLQEIEAYVEKEKPWNCAGSFKFESLGIALFESISSADPSALMGLPLIALTGFLRAAQLNPLTRNSF